MNTEILQHKKIPSLCIVSGFKVAAINVEVQYMMEFPPKAPKVLKNIFWGIRWKQMGELSILV